MASVCSGALTRWRRQRRRSFDIRRQSCPSPHSHRILKHSSGSSCSTATSVWFSGQILTPRTATADTPHGQPKIFRGISTSYQGHWDPLARKSGEAGLRSNGELYPTRKSSQSKREYSQTTNSQLDVRIHTGLDASQRCSNRQAKQAGWRCDVQCMIAKGSKSTNPTPHDYWSSPGLFCRQTQRPRQTEHDETLTSKAEEAASSFLAQTPNPSERLINDPTFIEGNPLSRSLNWATMSCITLAWYELLRTG